MGLLPVSGPALPRSCGSSSAAAVPERPRRLRAVPGTALLGQSSTGLSTGTNFLEASSTSP